MPAILTEDAARLWLGRSVNDANALTPLLTPYPADQMLARAVSPLVNSATHESPECIQPLESLF